jgi:hypothetical protein
MNRAIALGDEVGRAAADGRQVSTGGRENSASSNFSIEWCSANSRWW